jgi:hypothetical protein
MRSRVFPLAIISLFTPICFIALQAPHSTEAALASASQRQQERAQKEIPEACPVTKPPAQPFVPPPRYWTDHGPDGFWYGSESLWTLLAVHGTWKIRNKTHLLATRLRASGLFLSVDGSKVSGVVSFQGIRVQERSVPRALYEMAASGDVAEWC